MSDSGSGAASPAFSAVPKAVERFLAQDDDAVLADDVPAGEYPRAAVVRRDAAEARAVPTVAGVRSHVVGVYLRSAPGAVPVVPRPEWPALRSARSRSAQGGWWTVLRFAAPVDVAAVLAHVGRAGLVAPVLPAAPGGYDVRAVNPQGFEHHPTRGIVDLEGLDLPDGVTAGAVAGLRDVRAVRVDAGLGGDAALAHVVTGLALAGVPIVGSFVDEASGIAAPAVIPGDPDDDVAREELSILQRRAAFDAVFRGTHPSVSILLATKRPEMLGFALGQVARQRGVASLELVLAPHGFEPDVAAVRAAAGDGVEVQVLPQPADTIFGDVLQAATLAARGDVVLKMDDDDWYGPDVVADLLRAKAYSGADLVGMSAELHYLSEPDLTVKRGHPSERFVRFVAGGTTMLDRALLAEIGGWRRVRKFVDAQLIEGVLAAGGSVYRTHGLGYILRRNATGHTWQVDLDYLLDPARVESTIRGFRPNRLMEIEERHLPQR